MRADIRIDKMIARAAVSTLAAISILIAVLFGILALAFPQTMMDLTYSLGMDKACVNYALTSYARFDAIEYIAKGADTALAARMYDKADECLEYLVADEDFDQFCAKKNVDVAGSLSEADYRGYYLRQLCVAKYHAGKTTAAIDRAVRLREDDRDCKQRALRAVLCGRPSVFSTDLYHHSNVVGCAFGVIS